MLIVLIKKVTVKSKKKKMQERNIAWHIGRVKKNGNANDDDNNEEEGGGDCDNKFAPVSINCSICPHFKAPIP